LIGSIEGDTEKRNIRPVYMYANPTQGWVGGTVDMIDLTFLI